MAITDNITGIKIGEQVFAEGKRYNLLPQLTKTLQTIGLGGVSLSSGLASFDITHDQLTVYIDGVGTLGQPFYPFIPPALRLTAKFVLGGKASAKKTGAKQIASDFKIQKAGAGFFSSNTGELVASVAIKNLKLSKVSNALNKGIEQKGNLSDFVSSKIKEETLIAFRTPLPSGQVLADVLGLTPTPFRDSAIGAFASEFTAGAWYGRPPFPFPL